jgi:transposase-like protein
MQTPTEGSILREKLATVERKGAGKPFPDDLRRAVVDYGAKRLKAGDTVEGVARELGISAMSVVRRRRRRRRRRRPRQRTGSATATPSRSRQRQRCPRRRGTTAQPIPG